MYPETGTGGFEIKFATIGKGNIGTKLKSGWQEFWGPQGRLIEGSTVNNFRALTIWGRSINLYIYAIVILTAFFSLAYFFFLSSNLALAWKNCGKITLFAGLVFWGVLTFSQLISEYHQIRLDLERYDFRSLEEKRAIAVESFGRDFYPFLMFCKSHLPGRAKIKFLNTDPTVDYPFGRAKYFLYPIDFFAAEPDYLIVYNYEKDLKGVMKEYPGFRLWKRFNERGYLLWKK